MTRFRIHLISEPVVAYEFEDPRSLKELCDAVALEGYCSFNGLSNRLGDANQRIQRQTVFAANIARLSISSLPEAG
jgi:hypothetical protein